MANEAFALSPMSARAAEPNEQDYDAIREAFMETARGRWFLGEYAKRNRNADTRMVLDAVAKIEETLAAQRQPVVEDRLPEALVEIRRAIQEAEARAIAAFDPAAVEASLAPIPRGVRIIKEISWRWREIGADGRICDLIDSQLASIESACTQISAIDPRLELRAAFALLRDRTGQFEAGDSAPQAAAPSAAPAPTQEAPAAAAAPDEPMMASDEPVVSTETTQHVAIAAEAAVETAGAAEPVAMVEPAMEAAVTPEIAAKPFPAEMTGEVPFDAAAQAEDDAVLDAIALEMAAPDPEFDEILEPVGMEAAMPAPIAAQVESPVAAEPEPEPVAPEPVDDAPIAMESLVRLTDAIAEAAAEVMEQPAPAMAAAPTFGAMQSATLPMPSPLSAPPTEVSLGASIIASGMLEKPRAANDPLAPIRRMTQAEKIAFFS